MNPAEFTRKMLELVEEYEKTNETEVLEIMIEEDEDGDRQLYMLEVNDLFLDVENALAIIYFLLRSSSQIEEDLASCV